MSKEYRAFVFDFDEFERELRPILVSALSCTKSEALIAFMRQNLDQLRDPQTGDALGADWEIKLENKDVQACGDFALTNYYNPSENIAAGLPWKAIQQKIELFDSLTHSPILGHVVGRPDSPFDPGRHGSYCQSPKEVGESYVYMLRLVERLCFESELNHAVAFLEHAAKTGKGLYVTIYGG